MDLQVPVGAVGRHHEERAAGGASLEDARAHGAEHRAGARGRQGHHAVVVDPQRVQESARRLHSAQRGKEPAVRDAWEGQAPVEGEEKEEVVVLR
eukprot:8125487-Pyramimonas_sp.AAC.1